MKNTNSLNNMASLLTKGIGTPILLIIIISMLVLPLPPFLLDTLFTFNIAFALVVLLGAIYTKKPLDFAVFPTIILVATLLRLGLNVASTRVVLLNGHTGSDAAGQVIKSFGEVVIGGNYAVGLSVFVILVIINFVVVTKGGGRISEVTARFTLDAMPGKQMAIDADLNAGLISAEDAKKRREEISSEADFYGAMDGASKFVRGDAVAGILILLINLIGGLAIGVVQHEMSMGQAGENYALLTIGDGLVAQIPSLLLSTAAAIMVTRVSAEKDVGSQVVSEVFSQSKILIISAGIIALLGVIPGMPHVSFITLSLAMFAIAYFLNKNKNKLQPDVKKSNEPSEEKKPPESKEFGWEDVETVDAIGFEIGYRLIPLVDKKQNGELMSKIKGVRKKLSQELGFLIPTVHIRDNLDLSPNSYRINLMGVCVAEEEVYVDKLLAINPGQVYGKLNGIKTQDPSFGLEAYWIDLNDKDQANTSGYTVVDPSTVIATHISQVLKNNASELLGYEEVQKLLERITEQTPKLIEELIPNVIPMTTIVRIMQNLLQEGVPVRDIRSIIESIAEHSTKSQSPDFLLAGVRIALKRLIVQNINGLEKEVSVYTLGAELEQILQQSMQVQNEGTPPIEPGLLDRLLNNVKEAAEKQESTGQTPILLVSDSIRLMLARFIKSRVPSMHVLAYQEIPEDKQIRVLGAVN